MKVKAGTIGFDAEVFLKDPSTNKIVSAIPYINGTKHTPMALPSGGFMHHDNVLAEIGAPPSTSSERFVRYVNQALVDLETHISEYGLTYVITSAETLESEYLMDSQAQEFGCEAEYCIYGKKGRTIQLSSSDLGNIRTAGGHIHMSLPSRSIQHISRCVYICDALLGLYSVMNSPNGLNRRKFYGKAGSFRPKPYGLEYRVPDNFWLASDTYMYNIHKIAKYIATLNTKNLNSAIKSVNALMDYGESLQDIINTNNIKKAKSYFQVFDANVFGLPIIHE